MASLSLSISSVGDLLLNHKITKSQDGKPKNDIELSIPEYQRPYKWSARNAILLLDDIIEAKNACKEVYRVGTLILHHDKESNQFNIVDGQQRIITFSLLLHALYELENEENRAKISFLNQNVFSNSYSCHNIPNNLSAFRRRINKNFGDEADNSQHRRNMRSLRKFIEDQCELIVVITDDTSEAFQFFDSQNSRGKALYPHDLLKAYHLREMTDLDYGKTERIVKDWESIPQFKLASFFGDYIYRLKEWLNGNWAYKLDEHNIHKFKGINKTARTPFAQFYKSAFSYAKMVNSSAMPFVSGSREVNAFQLNTPVIAGEPFFNFTHHYYNILEDIRDNSKYEGFYIKDNVIVKTLDHHYNYGIGNGIARLLFDTALLLYVDKYCPATFPSKEETDLFEQFVVYAFIWAYSLRAQYSYLGWQSAQNYILEHPARNIVNAINIYKHITESDTPVALMSSLADRLFPLSYKLLPDKLSDIIDNHLIDEKDDHGIYKHYLYFFKLNSYLN